MTKNWIYSKTIWYAVLCVLVGIGNYIISNIELGTVITLNGLIVAILRVLTDKGITFDRKL